MDIQQAYRNIPVAVADQHLLRMIWKEVYVDKVFPFGLRSAPLIFSAIADALEWITTQQGASTLPRQLSNSRSQWLIGIPEKPWQLCPQSVSTQAFRLKRPRQTFLGLKIDSTERVIRLPADKLHNLPEMLHSWRGKKACKKWELLSLLGTLN